MGVFQDFHNMEFKKKHFPYPQSLEIGFYLLKPDKIKDRTLN